MYHLSEYDYYFRLVVERQIYCAYDLDFQSGKDFKKELTLYYDYVLSMRYFYITSQGTSHRSH